MPLSAVLKLESRYGIDGSYLIPGDGKNFGRQAQLPELAFRSHMLDPDFECDIENNGGTVTAAALIP